MAFIVEEEVNSNLTINITHIYLYLHVIYNIGVLFLWMHSIWDFMHGVNAKILTDLNQWNIQKS